MEGDFGRVKGRSEYRHKPHGESHAQVATDSLEINPFSDNKSHHLKYSDLTPLALRLRRRDRGRRSLRPKLFNFPRSQTPVWERTCSRNSVSLDRARLEIGRWTLDRSSASCPRNSRSACPCPPGGGY